jgi:O-antigen/teichoic acid export membrane protein
VSAVPGYLRRLLRTGAAYQVADVVSKVIALALLPLYTRELTRADYGTAELLLTVVILGSIVVRFGLGEAFVRFHFLDEDPDRRRRLARTATLVLLLTTTVAAGAMALLAGPVAELVLGADRPGEVRAAALGLWAFTNLELAYARLRVDERAREYALAALTNVALTVALTVWLVVVRDEGALGLLLGNFAASTVVLLGLWLRAAGAAFGPPDASLLPSMLRFGLPTVPAEVSVFALFFVDRLYLYRVAGEDEAGLYSLSVKLAAVVVFTVRAFQYAWPPLAYSIADDDEARGVYARITTYYVLFTGIVVAGIALLGRWVVRLLAAPDFFAAHEALPWVSLGWALYGLFLVLVAMAGRVQVTVRNLPAALAGLGANVLLLLVLVGPLGIAGAGIALCGAYAVMLVAMYALTRSLFRVDFEWGRLGLVVAVAGGAAVVGEVLLPGDGLAGFAGRVGLLLAIVPALGAAGFFRPGEREMIRGLLARARRRRTSTAAG